MNITHSKPCDFLAEKNPLPNQFARAFVVASISVTTLQAKSTSDDQVHTFKLDDGTATTLPGLAVQIERRVSDWLDDDHCSLRCIFGTDPSCIASRVAFIEKTPRVRTAPFTNQNDDFQVWEQGPKGCAPEYGRYEPSRAWCNHRLVDLGYALPEGIPEGYAPPAPVSQLETYLAANGGQLAVAGKTFRIDNIRNENGLGFFADVHGPRSKYFGMQVTSKVVGKAGAEVWDVMRMSGKSSLIVSFAIYKGTVHRLSF